MYLIEKTTSIEPLIQLYKHYIPNGDAEEIRQQYLLRQNDVTPKVMMFGSYNAGKSSFVNTLIGKNEAKVEDIPTTDKVESYLCQHCYLYDTPGINAPIEHEDVTNEQINRCELILFIVRDGDQDVEGVYQRMFELIKRGKQVFIVLNHELDEKGLAEASNKLNDCMMKYAAKNGLSVSDIASIPVMKINIATALRARLKNSQNLAEHSGINAFEERFILWLEQFNDKKHHEEHLHKFVQQTISAPILKAIDELLQGEACGQLEKLQIDRAEVVRHFDLLLTQMRNYIRSSCNSKKSDIAKLLSDESGIELEGEIQKIANDIAKQTAIFINDRCEEINDDLVVCISAENHKMMKANNAAIPHSNTISEALTTTIVDGLKSESVTQPLLEQGLKQLRSMKIPKIKGRWSKTLNRWSHSGAKALNIAVTVGTTLYEVYAASEEQNAMNEQERQAVLSVHQAIDELSMNINSAISNDASAMINQVKNNMLELLDKEISTLLASTSQYEKDKEQVLSLAMAA